MDITMLVNRDHPLPDGFCPDRLTDLFSLDNRSFFLPEKPMLLEEDAALALNRMCAAAKGEANLTDYFVYSAWRSHERQEHLYRHRRRDGYVAPPGCSEHETGLAIDIDVAVEDIDRLHLDWLHKNSWRYGYIVRYPMGRELITGISYEPWHFRYVGKELAAILYQNKWTLEEYYDRSIRPGRDIVVRMTNNIIEKMIWDFFSERIDNAFAIAGIMGNLFAESRLRPDALEFSTHERLGFSSEEYTKAVDDDTYLNFSDDHAGYGLAQWTDSERKNNLYAHAKDKGVSISDPTMQMEFLWEELSGGHIDVLHKLIESKSVQTASDIFLSDFENPFDQSDRVRQMRASYSRNYYYKYLTLEQLDESLSSYTDWRSDVCFFLQDYDTGEILYERNADRKCPIGSITKLMTAYSLMKRFLYDTSRLNEITVIDAETARMSNDRDFSGNEQFKAGEKVSLEQLLKLALISSACSSAVALVKHFYKEPADFVGQMNRDASELSIDASFADCFGIDPRNQGSARGIAGLGAAVISDYPWILSITTQKAVSHHGIEYPNTSILLKEDAVDGLDGLKTGTTNCAGACYLSTAQRRGHRVIAVVLNAQNEWERQMVIMDLLEYGLRKNL